MRQYLLSGTILSALAAGISLVRRTIRAPFSWQLALLWASWAISLVLAVMAVRESSRN